MLHSIRFKLLSWIIGSLFIILTASTWNSYQTNSNYEEKNYLQMQNSLKKRLLLSLPSGLWQLDKDYIESILDAELLHEAVIAIRAEDKGNIYIARQKNGIEESIPLAQNTTPDYQDKFTLSILYDEQKIGTIEVFLTTDPLNERLENNLWYLISVELIVLILIALFLTLGMNRYVFLPIKNLEGALTRTASLTVQDNFILPAQPYVEWASLVNGVNAIVEKITNELKFRQAAEKEALVEKERAELAYTQLIETQDALVQVEKMAALGRLVAGIAHEINTPIGITLTSASHLNDATETLKEQLANGQLKKSSLDDYIDVAGSSTALIMSNTRRAADLIQSFKQIAVDQTSQAKRVFLLAEYLEEIILSLRPKLKINPVNVKVICPEHIMMESYPGAISQVITNLVFNALLHAFDSGESGEIVVEGQLVDEKTVKIMVTDTGKGIPKEIQGKIFDPFFTTKQGNGGTGLGLHIVFNIVNQSLGGTIHVESSVAKGSCFIVIIPINAP